MNQEHVVEKDDSPGRPIVFLWKKDWDERTTTLEDVLEFINIGDQSPIFFQYFSEEIWAALHFIGEYRKLYSHAYFLFPAGDCHQRILDRIVQELPDDMPYEVYEIDESNMGCFFQRASLWDLMEEKERILKTR